MNTISCSLADAYVRAVNDGNANAYGALFHENALVDDGGREFRGRDAIRTWSASDIFAVNVRFEVVDSTERDGDAVLTTIVEGDFDRTGLPDPVVIVHRITAENEKVARLTCRLAD
jgi:hypothetical protein